MAKARLNIPPVINPLHRTHINPPAQPCPKCGAPTMSDEKNRWIACMMFDDIRSTAVVLRPGSPMPKFCDYGEWMPGGKEAAREDLVERQSLFGGEGDRALALKWLAGGHTHREIAYAFGYLYSRVVLPSEVHALIAQQDDG